VDLELRSLASSLTLPVDLSTLKFKKQVLAIVLNFGVMVAMVMMTMTIGKWMGEMGKCCKFG